ncbi:hypothetical protein [Nocardiopsis sp. NPDC006938]|uniref:hypothetical protein n=1 Tax=Nocardiopsis sp. NPDC006938 TaxID=3364337 RepID=UPI0036CE24E6
MREAVATLRARGYGANATNRFDRVLDDYDATDLDLVLFGGQVPHDLRARLEAAIAGTNPRTRFLSGLGGIGSLLVAQVEEHTHGTAPGIAHEPHTRTLGMTLSRSARVVVTGHWAEYTPSEPVPRSITVSEGELPAGTHLVEVPDEVPERGAFASVRIGERTRVLRIGPAPRPDDGPAPGAPPAPEPVTTRHPWTS